MPGLGPAWPALHGHSFPRALWEEGVRDRESYWKGADWAAATKDRAEPRKARRQPCQMHADHRPRLLPGTITAVNASRSWGPQEHPL